MVKRIWLKGEKEMGRKKEKKKGKENFDGKEYSREYKENRKWSGRNRK